MIVASVNVETIFVAVFSGIVAGIVASVIVPRTTRSAYRMLFYLMSLGALYTLPQAMIRFIDPSVAVSSWDIFIRAFIFLWIPFALAAWIMFVWRSAGHIPPYLIQDHDDDQADDT